MRIWLLRTTEPLPTHSSGIRLFRMGLIAQALRARGHEIVWWNSTFDHFSRKLLADDDSTIQIDPNFTVKLIHSQPYSKNISIKRIFYNRRIAKKFLIQAKSEPQPDLIIASWPTVDLCESAVIFGQERQIPVILDIRDLWPDLFLDASPKLIRPLVSLLLRPLIAQAKRTARGATGLIGITEEYLDWALHKAGRTKNKVDRIFSLAHVDDQPSPAQIASEESFWDKFGVTASADKFIICYFGVFSQFVDFDTIITAAQILQQANRSIQFVLCGRGDDAYRSKCAALGLKNVCFPGWVSPEAIWVLMRRAKFGLAPYRAVKNFLLNLPNKPIEYISAGLPILSSLDRGPVGRLISDYQTGLSYRPESPEDLARVINLAQSNPEQLKSLSNNALAHYQQNYVARNVYSGMVDYLEQLVKAAEVPIAANLG